jgi:hypothetical protein
MNRTFAARLRCDLEISCITELGALITTDLKMDRYTVEALNLLVKSLHIPIYVIFLLKYIYKIIRRMVY